MYILIIFELFSLVVSQDYRTQVVDESVLKGNSAILKCLIPSFVADFVTVKAWVDNQGMHYRPSQKYGKILFKILHIE